MFQLFIVCCISFLLVQTNFSELGFKRPASTVVQCLFKYCTVVHLICWFDLSPFLRLAIGRLIIKCHESLFCTTCFWNVTQYCLDDTNVNKIAFTFPTWFSVSNVSILITDQTPLVSFYLETSTSLHQAQASNWLNLPTSFVPGREFCN